MATGSSSEESETFRAPGQPQQVSECAVSATTANLRRLGRRQQTSRARVVPASCSVLRGSVVAMARSGASPLVHCARCPHCHKALRRGLERYIKKKAKAPLETYVPAVLQARGQVLKAGEVMGEDAASARSLLREGAFDGLRDNIRAIGEYAVEGGRVGEAGALVASFFGALEKFDFALFEAVRFERPVAPEGRQLLDSAVAALDKLVATVPDNELSKAREVVATVEQRGEEARAAAAEEQAREAEALRYLLSGPISKPDQ